MKSGNKLIRISHYINLALIAVAIIMTIYTISCILNPISISRIMHLTNFCYEPILADIEIILFFFVPAIIVSIVLYLIGSKKKK